MRHARRILKIVAVLLALFFAGFVVSLVYPKPNADMLFGVSFDPIYAHYLGLDPGQTLTKILDEWKFRYIRFGLHWDSIESTQNSYSFSQFDPLMQMAQSRGAKVVLAVGQKTPRWPECHIPDWAAALVSASSTNMVAYHARLEAYITATVNHYKNNPSLEMWQVENEPFFPFGNCPLFSPADLQSEIALVHKLDPNHKVIVTDSGELSTWMQTVHAADYFGSTMYRVVWNKFTGYISYDWLPAWSYRAKLAMLGRDRQSAFVMELQAEPWLPAQNVQTVPLSEQFKSLGIDQLNQNLEFAQRVDFGRTYLWGAEWWAWLEGKGHPEFADAIAGIRKK